MQVRYRKSLIAADFLKVLKHAFEILHPLKFATKLIVLNFLRQRYLRTANKRVFFFKQNCSNDQEPTQLDDKSNSAWNIGKIQILIANTEQFILPTYLPGRATTLISRRK